MKKNQYTQKLEGVIKQMLNPLKGLPFNLVIESLSGFRVIPFDRNTKKDKELLKKLIEVAKITGKEINNKGIKRKRPNEVGNDIEDFVVRTLNKLKLEADIPTTSSGQKRGAGYPDIEFTDQFGEINYLECKTFNIKSVGTSFRSFYLSPSENFKITRDAHHFVMSFEIYPERRSASGFNFKCRSWKILSIENLIVDVKYEFNSDNARLYNKELILAEGIL